jgi:antitoxin component HigA of HigAB toxin-antitoxin module
MSGTRPIRNEREYDQAVKRLNGLLDEIGTDERHPLYGLLDMLGTLIHAYEEKHFKEGEVCGFVWSADFRLASSTRRQHEPPL